MTGKWKDINREHVIKAIQKYDEEGIESYSRNTFLVYNNKKYPAKHIRAMAYEVAFNEPADKSKFTGGKETVNFFENLGFTVDYKGNGQEKHERKLNNKKDQVLLTLPIVRKLMASSAAQQTKTLSDCRFFNPESVNLTTIPDNLFPSSFLRQ